MVPGSSRLVLRAWYKFDTLTGSNGDQETTVADASSNGFNLTAPSGPLSPLLAVADQNGLNTLQFGLNTLPRYYPLSTSIFSGSSAGSAYIVYKVNSDSVNNGLMDWGTSGTDNHWPYLDGNIYCDFGSTVRKTVGNPAVTQTVYRIYSLYSAASDWAFSLMVVRVVRRVELRRSSRQHRTRWHGIPAVRPSVRIPAGRHWMARSPRYFSPTPSKQPLTGRRRKAISRGSGDLLEIWIPLTHTN